MVAKSEVIFENNDLSRVWVTSDLHYGHRRILNYSPARNRFANGDINVHDDLIVQTLNDSVGEDGILLCLGDLAMREEKMIELSARLVTRERFLILGNHDNCPAEIYKDTGWKILPMFVTQKVAFTHFPVHPCEMAGSDSGWGHYIVNVHGHIHQNSLCNPRYLNVCLEVTGMAPLRLIDILNYARHVEREYK